MSKADTARTYYQQARAELNLRIQLRDYVLLYFLGIVATLFGVALAQEAAPGGRGLQVVLAVPFVAVGAAVIVSQHHTAMGAMVAFFSKELDLFLKGLTPPEDAVQWDNSSAAKQYVAHAMFQRTLGHGAIILLPCVAALLANSMSALSENLFDGAFWWSGLIATFFAIFTLIRAHRFRNQINRSLNWRD